MITKSSYIVGHAQIDGRKYVTETHVFDTGEVVSLEYLTDSKEYDAILSEHAVNLEAERAVDAERQALLEKKTKAEQELKTFIKGLGVSETKGHISAESLDILKQ